MVDRLFTDLDITNRENFKFNMLLTISLNGFYYVSNISAWLNNRAFRLNLELFWLRAINALQSPETRTLPKYV